MSLLPDMAFHGFSFKWQKDTVAAGWFLLLRFRDPVTLSVGVDTLTLSTFNCSQVYYYLQ